MNPPDADAYEALLALSEQMLEAARAGDWEKVVELEHRSRSIVEQLAQVRPEVPSDAGERERRRTILLRTLDNDAEIRRLALPEMARLEVLLGGLRRERKLRGAYNEPPDD